MAEGTDRLSHGGCRNAPALENRLDAAECADDLRRFLDGVSQYQLDSRLQVKGAFLLCILVTVIQMPVCCCISSRCIK